MNLTWTDIAWGQYEEWQKQDKKIVKKINEIINQYRNKKILVVAHAGVIQALISYYLFGNLDGYWKFKINNGSITKLYVMEDGYTYFEYINLT